MLNIIPFLCSLPASFEVAILAQTEQASRSASYELVRQLGQDHVLIPILIAGSVVTVVIVRTLGAVLKGSSRERTRREIAAFIAEGSMTPEQGERLMRAGDKREQA